MEVVEKEHDRHEPARLLDEGRHLSLHPLRRSVGVAGVVDVGAAAPGCEPSCGVPARRDGLHHAGEAAMAFAPKQRLERFEDRQVRVAPRKPFRTSSATDADGIVLSGDRRQKRLHERRLAHTPPRPRSAHNAAMPDRAWAHASSSRASSASSDDGDGRARAPEARTAARHGRGFKLLATSSAVGPQPWILLQALEDDLIVRGRHPVARWHGATGTSLRMACMTPSAEMQEMDAGR